MSDEFWVKCTRRVCSSLKRFCGGWCVLLFLSLFNKILLGLDWCGSVSWVSSRKVKGHQFISQSGDMLGLRVWLGYKRQPIDVSLSHRCFSPFSKNKEIKSFKSFIEISFIPYNLSILKCIVQYFYYIHRYVQPSSQSILEHFH